MSLLGKELVARLRQMGLDNIHYKNSDGRQVHLLGEARRDSELPLDLCLRLSNCRLTRHRFEE
jgi:hypothetical protein